MCNDLWGLIFWGMSGLDFLSECYAFVCLSVFEGPGNVHQRGEERQWNPEENKWISELNRKSSKCSEVVRYTGMIW